MKTNDGVKSIDFEGAKVKITSGDYAPLMQAVNEQLHKAVVSYNQSHVSTNKYLCLFSLGWS